ncbi:MAG: HAD-superfamily hydrolase, subfamily variant 3 [Holophagaceae bacterium]|nr:HAD-superfamily hydrolase, subfamily variant 3 [Holophagaceae bacterium]
MSAHVFAWKPAYELHYKELDEQHRGLLEILNEAHRLSARAKPVSLREIFGRLGDYALIHFSTEERYMKAAGYEGLTAHQAEHGHFISRVLELSLAYDPSDPKLLKETQTFLENWVHQHIGVLDLEFGNCLRGYRDRAPIRGIIFDFGNVICRFDNGRFLRALSGLSGLPVDELEKRIYGLSTLTEAFERGDMDGSSFMKGMEELCGCHIHNELLISAYTEIFTPIESTCSLIRRLKPHYKLGLLSNTNPWHFERGISTIPVFPLFDAVTLSYEARALKPDPRIYQDALDKLGLMAEECLFIDDRAEFTEAADRQLLHGITYTGYAELRSALKGFNIRGLE